MLQVIEEVVVEEAYAINEWEEIIYDEYEAAGIKEQLKCIAKGCAAAAGCIFGGPFILKCVAVVCVAAAIISTMDAIGESL